MGVTQMAKNTKKNMKIQETLKNAEVTVQPDLFKQLREQRKKINEELRKFKEEHKEEFEAKKKAKAEDKANRQNAQAEKCAKEIVKSLRPKMKSLGLFSAAIEPRKKWAHVNIELLASHIKTITGFEPFVKGEQIMVILQTAKVEEKPTEATPTTPTTPEAPAIPAAVQA